MTLGAASGRIILASGSESRAVMLRAAGVPFRQVPPNVDEDAAKAALIRDSMQGEDLANALAELKAIEVSARFPEALIIGADQVLTCEGRCFNKARSLDEARAILIALRGREHRLVSSVIMAVDAVPIWRRADTAYVRMRDFSDAFLDAYLASEGDAVLSSVGCYHIEGRGAQLFSHIAGDQFTIRGLPLLPVLEMLRQNKVLLP